MRDTINATTPINSSNATMPPTTPAINATSKDEPGAMSIAPDVLDIAIAIVLSVTVVLMFASVVLVMLVALTLVLLVPSKKVVPFVDSCGDVPIGVVIVVLIVVVVVVVLIAVVVGRGGGGGGVNRIFGADEVLLPVQV